MAELDDKLLKNLDKTLESMNERLITLETTLSGVKNGLNKTFDPSIITSFSDALRGIKTLRLIDAEKASQDINKVKDTLAKLQDAYQKWEGGELALSPKALSNLTDLLAKYKELNKNIDKGSEQRSVELANAAKKEADAVEAEERRKQKEFQKTANEQAKLLKAYSDIEQARSVVTGGKKFGELDAEQTKKYKEFGRTLDDLKKKMDDLEKASPGSKAAGTQIFKEQEAVTKAKREAAEEQTRIKKEQAEQERQINEAIKEEERRRAAENKRMLDEEKKALADYIRLFSEKQSILKNVAPLGAKVIRNQPLTEQERGLYDASWNRIYAIQDQMAKLRESYVSVLEYEEKIQANGQEQVALGKVRLTQEQALAKEKERQAKSESKKQSDEAKIQKQADAIVKKRIDLERQVQRIDNDRAIRQQTNSKISQQALDAESRKYEALLQRINQLNNALSKLEGKQAGVTARAEQRNVPYMNYVAAAEEERKAKAIENSTKKLKEQKNTLDSMLPTLQRLASAFGVAFSVRGLAQFGKKLIETRGEFERQQVALRSILQNKQLADEIWDKTMQAALQSPFTAMQLTTYTKQLAAYRIETDKLFETTKRLADVSAGLGVDMNRLILAYGQVKAANYLRASEIRQFTEAGVNVLGELRDYFNDVKGMSVDTAQVMEMVTKRLVTFEDVEAIFKRMTDQGGIFYEMQYVQSQTVRGQIAKLHDAYDQMLNSIGQANEGALKNMVSLLNSIVKNWQEFKTVIDLIAWPLLISFVYKFSRGLMTTAAASVATSASMNKLTVAGARTQLMFKRLFATIAAHPFIALGAAVAAVGVALLNHAKHVRDINKRYEDLMLRTYETQKNLDGLSETIQSNLDTMKKATKGSEEYNEASRENENIVKKLKDQYPELLQGIDLQKDGYEKLIEKIKEYNEELENNIRLEYAARAGFWQDDLTTNIADLQEAQRKREMQFLQNRNLAETEYLKNGKKDNDIWWERIRLAKTWQEQVDIINQQNEAARGGGLSLQSYGFVVPGVGGFGGGSVETNLANLSNNIKQEALVYNDIIRDQLKTINEDLGDDIQQFITDNETQINELFKDKEGAGWKLLNKQITKFFTAKGATDKESREAIQNFLNEYLLIPIQLDWDNIGGTSGSTTPPQTSGNETKENASKLISLIKEMRGEYDKLSKSAYGYAKSEENVREAYRDSVKEILGRAGITDYDFTTNEGMIQALEKVKTYATRLGKDAAAEVQKYIDQLETEIEINAQVRIREDFGKQMERALNEYELTLELDKLNLPKGLAADMWGIEETDLEDLRKRLSQMYMGLRDENGQLSDEAFKDYEKFLNKIDDLERNQQKERLKDYSKYLEAQYSERVKIEMDYVRKLAALEAETEIKEPQKREIREGLNREFLEKSRKQDWEDFKGSEFYVGMMEDLEKQGSASLEVMRKKLLEMRENAENLSPRALKEVVNALEKIDELEKKRTPSLKRIREEQEKLRGVEIKDVYKRIAANQEKLAQDEQEQKDLERMIMLEEERQKLEKQGITLEEAKARLAKSEQALSLILPSLDTRSDGSKDAEERRRIMSEAVNQAKTEVEKWQEIVRILSGQFIIDAQEQGSKYKGLSLSVLKSRRDDAKKRIKDLEGFIDKDEELVKAQKDWEDAWNDTWETVKKWAQSVNGIFDGVMESVDYFTDETYGMVGAWREFGDTSISALTDLVSGIQAYQEANAAAKKEGLATGLLTANGLQLAMVVLSVIIKVVQALAKLHDARLDKEIQIQQEKIDNLQRAYERLEKQIEKTWSTVSYIRTYREETQNLYEQYEALTKQIRAEEAKKNTDKDKLQDYQDKQQEILDTLGEIKQQQIEVFGGIGEDNYRSAAEGFVEAWKSAFLETGDGLQGLQDHFDEFLDDWFVKQATMRIAASNLEPLFRKIDDAVDQDGVGGANVTWQELKEINDLKDTLLNQTNEQLSQLAGVFGLGGEGSLSGLAAGIQGMTEEQANILEAYWNSVRMYTASIDMNVARIAEILGGGRDMSNPQLTYLESIARNTGAIYSFLQSVSKGGHAENGMGIKVFVN